MCRYSLQPLENLCWSRFPAGLQRAMPEQGAGQRSHYETDHIVFILSVLSGLGMEQSGVKE